MKLKGTRQEKEFRKALQNSSAQLRDVHSGLRQFLLSEGHAIESAIVLEAIPDQLDDEYLVLIDREYLLRVEIGKSETEGSSIVSAHPETGKFRT